MTNIVFLGSVDTGKSTLAGQILVQTGAVDIRQIDKCKRLAKEKGMDSWYLAYLLDSSDEEMETGKTVEVGSSTFIYRDRGYTILDAPGHEAYISKMIYALSMADVGIVLISARSTEFESSVKGSLIEHISLAKVMGVDRLILAINKVDLCDNKERLIDLERRARRISKTCGYPDVDLVHLSAYQGDGVVDLLNILSDVRVNTPDGDFRMAVAATDGHRVYGKVFVGRPKMGDYFTLVPTLHQTMVKEISYGECLCESKIPGERGGSFKAGYESLSIVNSIIDADIVDKSSEKDCRSHIDSILLSSVVHVGDFLCGGSVKETTTILCEVYAFDFIVTSLQAILHIHTASLPCEVIIVGRPTLSKGKKGKVIIKTETPFFTEKGTRWGNVAVRTNRTVLVGIVIGVKHA